MSRIRSILAGMLAMLVIAVGFLLPQAVLALQDRQLAGRVDHYETVPVRFYSSRQVTDTLSLLAGSWETRSSAPDYARLSGPQVYALALECLEDLAQEKIFAGDPQVFASYSAAPSLYYADGSGTLFPENETELSALVSSRLSAVVWDCTLTDGAASVRLTVDDATGLVTSISCWLGTRKRRDTVRGLSGQRRGVSPDAGGGDDHAASDPGWKRVFHCTCMIFVLMPF